MEFRDLVKDSFFHLPKEAPKNTSYREFIFDLLDQYLLLLSTLKNKTVNIEGLSKPKRISTTIKIQDEFIKGLKRTIHLYLDGQPSNAYAQFQDTINYRTGKYKKILNISSFHTDENFYRIRLKQENFALSSKEMFHIPFELRGKVTTQRYSIPGFPSLYLAKTLYVGWEELHRPSLNNFQAVRLKNVKKLKYLDLTASNISENLTSDKAYKYLMTWPLIACCSIKVGDYSDPFKPQYIVPQLLTQWIRNNKELDAIKYNSTHITTNDIETTGDLYNIVLPVRDNKDSGYCDNLTNMFEITETISQQLLDFKSGGMTFLDSEKEIKRISDKIPAIEFIRGSKTPYGYSILGKLEKELDRMKTKKIH